MVLTLQNFLNTFLQITWRGLQGTFWLAWWLFSVGILANYLMRWWPGDRLVTVRLVNYLLPWLLISLIPGLIIALVARRQWLALTLALPTLLISLNYAPLFLPRPRVALAGSEPLKVMSYNIWSRNNDIQAIAAQIQAEQPDVLLLQELRRDKAQNVVKALEGLYPATDFYFTYEPRFEQGIISRYPLTPLEASYDKGKAQKVLVETPSGPITVWNIHTTSGRWRTRYRQVSNLTRDIAAMEGPLIVGGDFNTTDQTEVYGMINQYLPNAHWQAGWGFGFSFPSPHRPISRKTFIPSLVRIDHIFYSHHFTIRRAATLSNAGGSDHFPVVATFFLVR